MVVYDVVEKEIICLTAEGKEVQQHGSQEARVYNALPVYNKETPQGLSMAALATQVGADVAKIGQGKAFKNVWIAKNAANELYRATAEVKDDAQTWLTLVKDGETAKVTSAQLNDLKKRKWTASSYRCCFFGSMQLGDSRADSKLISYDVQRGPAFALTIQKQATDLTMEMLADGSWKNTEFKKYNYDALGASIPHGALHPLMKVREEIRQIFLEMG